MKPHLKRHLSIAQLTQKAKEYRRTLIDITVQTGGAYLSQAMSGIDLMTCLFHCYLKFNPKQPDWDKRDRFLLSPGHYALALYVILADLGYFDQKLLYTFKENESPFELISHRGTLPGVEVSGGSLGQALSVGVGMALHAKLRYKAHQVFVFMSDGEQDEGQIWEAAMSAAHFKLNNLIAIIDANGFQVDGQTKEVMDSSSLLEKYRSFNWEAKEVNGHNLAEIGSALDELCLRKRDKPAILISQTIRGKGIDFMENNPAYHYTRFDTSTASKLKKDFLGDADAI